MSVIEMADQLLPQEDAELAGEVLKSLKRQGVKVHLSSAVSAVESIGDGRKSFILIHREKKI